MSIIIDTGKRGHIIPVQVKRVHGVEEVNSGIDNLPVIRDSQGSVRIHEEKNGIDGIDPWGIDDKSNNWAKNKMSNIDLMLMVTEKQWMQSVTIVTVGKCENTVIHVFQFAERELAPA